MRRKGHIIPRPGDAGFRCGHCDEEFRRSEHLERHQRACRRQTLPSQSKAGSSFGDTAVPGDEAGAASDVWADSHAGASGLRRQGTLHAKLKTCRLLSRQQTLNAAGCCLPTRSMFLVTAASSRVWHLEGRGWHLEGRGVLLLLLLLLLLLRCLGRRFGLDRRCR